MRMALRFVTAAVVMLIGVGYVTLRPAVDQPAPVQTTPLPAPPPPPSLGVEGPSLTVNGTPRFLIFISYFDAMRRLCPDATGDCAGRQQDIDTDLAYFKAHGIDGIRIFPNWFHYASGRKANDDALFAASGEGGGAAHIRQDKWRVLRGVLDRSAAHGLLVDVTFTSDTVQGLSPHDYASQIGEVAERLAGRDPHVLFDISNEYPRWSTRDEMRRILTSQIRRFDASRIVTASIDAGSVDSVKAGEDAAFIAGDDPRFIAAYHEGRDTSRWYQEDTIRRVIEELRQKLGPSRPIYLQEPMPVSRFCADCGGVVDAAPGHPRAAMRAAKAAGAAAWTFHTRNTFDLAARRYVDIVPEGSPERTELEALR